eukprot:4474753-Pleurochrysis_carterae.AAC.4
MAASASESVCFSRAFAIRAFAVPARLLFPRVCCSRAFRLWRWHRALCRHDCDAIWAVRHARRRARGPRRRCVAPHATDAPPHYATCHSRRLPLLPVANCT